MRRTLFPDQQDAWIRRGEPPSSKKIARIRIYFALYALALIAAGLLYAGWHVRFNYQRTQTTAERHLLAMGTALQTELNAKLHDGLGAARAAYNHLIDFVVEEPDELAGVLHGVMTGGDYVQGIFAAVPDKFVLANRDGPVEIAATPPAWLKCPPTESVCVLDPIRNSTMLPIVTRIEVAAGDDYLMGALFGLQELHELYRRLDMNDGTVALIRTDGLILVRAENAEAADAPLFEPRSSAHSEIYAQLDSQATNADVKLLEGTSSVSGKQILSAVARVNSDVPLLIAVSAPTDTILAPWKRSTFFIVGVALVGLAVLLIASALLSRYLVMAYQREAQFFDVIASSLSSIWLLKNGRIHYANARAIETFRTRPDGNDILGASLLDLSPEKQPDGGYSEAIAKKHLDAMKSQHRVRFPWTFRRLDTNAPFEAQVSLSSIQVGKHEWTLAITHDISELVQSQRELEALNATLERRVAARTRELEEVNADLEQFTAAASHDLRSPLGSISGQASFIGREFGDQEAPPNVKMRLDRIHDGVRRATGVIDGLLCLARISRSDLNNETLSLSALAQQIVSEIREADPDREAHVVCEADIYVRADPHLMASLMRNLIGNAWKYSSKTSMPLIEFGRLAGPEGPVYFVRDNGAGFDMSFASQIFQPFRRYHSQSEFPGTGVGLATVHRIVTRYRGKIWTESAVGFGATFYFTLPDARVGDMRRRA